MNKLILISFLLFANFNSIAQESFKERLDAVSKNMNAPRKFVVGPEGMPFNFTFYKIGENFYVEGINNMCNGISYSNDNFKTPLNDSYGIFYLSKDEKTGRQSFSYSEQEGIYGIHGELDIDGTLIKCGFYGDESDESCYLQGEYKELSYDQKQLNYAVYKKEIDSLLAKDEIGLAFDKLYKAHPYDQTGLKYRKEDVLQPKHAYELYMHWDTQATKIINKNIQSENLDLSRTQIEVFSKTKLNPSLVKNWMNNLEKLELEKKKQAHKEKMDKIKAVPLSENEKQLTGLWSFKKKYIFLDKDSTVLTTENKKVKIDYFDHFIEVIFNNDRTFKYKQYSLYYGNSFNSKEFSGVYQIESSGIKNGYKVLFTSDNMSENSVKEFYFVSKNFKKAVTSITVPNGKYFQYAKLKGKKR